MTTIKKKEKKEKRLRILLAELNAVIDTYSSLEDADGNTLIELLQRLSTTLFSLEFQRVKYHKLYNKKMDELIAKGESKVRAEIIANKEYPELYLLRRIMGAAYKVNDAIRSNLSYVKEELNKLNYNPNA